MFDFCRGKAGHRALSIKSINTARPVRTVKLLNGTQNVWTSGQSNPKVWINFDGDPFSLDFRISRSLNQIFLLIQRKRLFTIYMEIPVIPYGK